MAGSRDSCPLRNLARRRSRISMKVTLGRAKPAGKALTGQEAVSVADHNDGHSCQLQPTKGLQPLVVVRQFVSREIPPRSSSWQLPHLQATCASRKLSLWQMLHCEWALH